ncbi:MAG: NAD+ synthase [Acidobacteria bacterium]|nr:NAD+ synthase [Acidobacteriota bacterium]
MKPPALPMTASQVEALLAGFLREEVSKAGFSRAVVGVSGGLDSAVVLLLCARALGGANVHGVVLPYRTSSPDSLRDAMAVIELAGCTSEVIDITPMIDAFQLAAGCEDRLRLGNRMARERMTLLYDRALRDGALVVGTSNKTELLLGYSTRWGDGAWDLDPIGDLYKSQVRELAAHLGVPAPILDKPPSADLWPGQTDEQELGLTYATADLVLWYLVDQRGRPERAARELGVPAEIVARIARCVVKTQFKRNLPLICKVQERTVGIDFRLPRDWGL